MSELPSAELPALREPDHFGSWRRVGPHPTQAWAYVCTHDVTGDQATVELHFSDDVAYGNLLRRAVDANPRLLAWGAERLLDSGRLGRYPGEGWHNPPPGEHVYWVARAERTTSQAPRLVTRDTIAAAAVALIEILDAAGLQRLPLALRPDDLSLDGETGVHVRRPGLPPFPADGPEAQSLAWLRSLVSLENPGGYIQSVGPETISAVESATSLRGLLQGLSTPYTARLSRQSATAPVPFWRRALGFLVDAPLAFATWFAWIVVGLIVFPDEGWQIDTWIFYGLFTTVPFYHWFWITTASRTPGMLVTGLKVISEDTGRDVTWGRALLRALVLYLGAVFVIGCLWALWEQRRRTLHDLASKSLVVRA